MVKKWGELCFNWVFVILIQWLRGFKICDTFFSCRKIIAEFELMIAQMMGKLTQTMHMSQSEIFCVMGFKKSLSFYFDAADREKEREESQKKLNEAVLEKEQVSSDLNTMERSFADLFKRLEKYKDVVQGYKKVGKHEHSPCFKPQILTHFYVLTRTVAVQLVNGFLPFPQNEETLKACAQDYLARIKKEEQRYQTLKAHAEEKISQ